MKPGLPTITAIGSVVATPELHTTNRGVPVTNLTVACNHKRKTKTGTWVTSETVYLKVTAWRTLALNIANEIQKGDLVSVEGNLIQKEGTTAHGDKVLHHSVEAENVSLSLQRNPLRGPIRETQAPTG